MAKFVLKGTETVLARMQRVRDAAINDAIVAVEQTCADICKHAKDGHAGNMAHASGRYKNRTSNLTNSIVPLEPVIDNGVITGYAAAMMEYAAFVELGTSRSRPYPYMFPAMAANRDTFKKRMLMRRLRRV